MRFACLGSEGGGKLTQSKKSHATLNYGGTF